MPENIRGFALSGLGISLIAGTFLSILAPYDTGAIAFLPRFFYWTVLCLAGGMGAALFLPIAGRLGWAPSKVSTILGQSITSSIFVTLMLGAWNGYHSSSVDIKEALVLFFFVWVIGITVTTIAHLAERASDPDLGETSKRPELFERLKPGLRAVELYALSAEDHYVRAIMETGEDLILMRLGDAIKESAPLKGLRVHRSWWVAEKGVKSIQKNAGKTIIELKSGQTVPVSRSNMKALKDAGWT